MLTISTADEAINHIARHAYFQGTDLENVELLPLRSCREAAEVMIRIAFVIAAKVEDYLGAEGRMLLPVDIKNLLHRVRVIETVAAGGPRLLPDDIVDVKFALMTASEAILDIAEHAYLQGAGAESAQLRKRREAAERVIRLAFATTAEIKAYYESSAESGGQQSADTWAETILKRANAAVRESAHSEGAR